MLAKIKISSAPSNGFSNYVYWGDSYETVFYLDLQFKRPTLEVNEEVNEDQFGNKTVLFSSVIQKDKFDFLANAPFLSALSYMLTHSIKQLEILELDETYSIANINLVDNGDENELLGTVTIEIEGRAINSDNCDQDFTLIAC